MADYVDVSSHNGAPDLKAYWADGHRELMLKATEGTGYAWAQMQSLASQWHSFGADARVGYYHWLYGTLSASAQYQWFWSHVGPVFRPGDWLMTDFEDVDPSRWVSDAAHCASVTEFDRLCAQHSPVHDYAPDWYIANMPLCVAYFRTRLNVASDYTNNPPGNRFGRTYVAHQFTDRASVAGFLGPVDYNRWLVETTAGSGTPQPVQEGPFMTLPQTTLDALVHQVGTTDANVKSIYAWTQSTLLRVASIGATQATQAASLDALHAAVTALDTAPPGSIDPAAITALNEAIRNLPTEVRDLFESRPLIIGGSAK